MFFIFFLIELNKYLSLTVDRADQLSVGANITFADVYVLTDDVKLRNVLAYEIFEFLMLVNICGSICCLFQKDPLQRNTT